MVGGLAVQRRTGTAGVCLFRVSGDPARTSTQLRHQQRSSWSRRVRRLSMKRHNRKFNDRATEYVGDSAAVCHVLTRNNKGQGHGLCVEQRYFQFVEVGNEHLLLKRDKPGGQLAVCHYAVLYRHLRRLHYAFRHNGCRQQCQ